MPSQQPQTLHTLPACGMPAVSAIIEVDDSGTGAGIPLNAAAMGCGDLAL